MTKRKRGETLYCYCYVVVVVVVAAAVAVVVALLALTKLLPPAMETIAKIY